MLIAGAATALATGAVAEERALTGDEARALEIYRRIIAMRTVEGAGKVPEMANFLANEFLRAGFAKTDVEVRRFGETAALIVRYRGSEAGSRPILFLAHMDVVDAKREDWDVDPFALTEKDGFFVGRGATDNKYGVMNLTQTFIRLKREKFTPTRDLILAFTGDEETSQATAQALAADPSIAAAEYALNTDAGGGALTPDGAPIIYGVQAAEKTYASFELSAVNRGGHSSLPRADNAIYDLADALAGVRSVKFPIMWNAVTLRAFETMGPTIGGELGDAMRRFARDPKPGKYAERIAENPEYVGQVRTTCVPTLLAAGHAENALPQSAKATVNCRIFPGMSAETVQSRLEEAVRGTGVTVTVVGDPPLTSPVSELRPEVLSAVRKAVQQRYPDIPVAPYMEPGATDGLYFRRAGVPTWAVSAIIMDPAERNEHGRDEKIPRAAFFDGLDHWMIIIKELAGAPGGP
jgi:acetylornithine deacetylase/succinyl-diaminopimelate desuccinylase-like protein